MVGYLYVYVCGWGPVPGFVYMFGEASPVSTFKLLSTVQLF